MAPDNSDQIIIILQIPLLNMGSYTLNSFFAGPELPVFLNTVPNLLAPCDIGCVHGIDIHRYVVVWKSEKNEPGLSDTIMEKVHVRNFMDCFPSS